VDDAGSAEDGYAASVQRLLHLLRIHVGMDVAWTSEFVGSEQVFRFVDAAAGKAGPEPGTALPLSSAYCTNVLAGSMPSVIPDSHTDPMAALLPITFELRIGAYLGVPMAAPDGTVGGMLCVISSDSLPHLSERELTSARLIADVIADLHTRALGTVEANRRRAELHAEVAAICAGRGRRAVLQPVVDLTTGDALAGEGLTRFASERRTPAEWFSVAGTVGLRRELEVGAAEAIIDLLDAPEGPPNVSINLSPDVIAAGDLDQLLARADAHRVIVEITEHAPVGSYDDLHAALGPHRASGLRIAVDDAGAGYASMTHVLRLRPDFIKIDMSLVRGIDCDEVRRALVAAMTGFGRDTGAAVIAEGVETSGELGALGAIGVRYAQGFLFGQPTERPRWTGHPVPQPV
jgi:EAL domain-containing protein (putative c-di-GMP-specific phosphodiesterase class I)